MGNSFLNSTSHLSGPNSGASSAKCVDMQLFCHGKGMGPELAALPPPQGIIPPLPSTGDYGLNMRGADTKKHMSMGQRPYFFPSTHVIHKMTECFNSRKPTGLSNTFLFSTRTLFWESTSLCWDWPLGCWRSELTHLPGCPL